MTVIIHQVDHDIYITKEIKMFVKKAKFYTGNILEIQSANIKYDLQPILDNFRKDIIDSNFIKNGVVIKFNNNITITVRRELKNETKIF